ncbi:xaa-Arg dipeptidase [Parasteatoda tepidariorum]|uniref:xaa-Arg dipeptidase n=1 Tax=Parasteatoda tepidariorum TaxID=114398 RepID=UPI001C726DB4|nr:peptidase M20 domain-containing protein 2 [Parasteatoda tepidariorum]
MEKKFLEVVDSSINNEAKLLNRISEEIWKNPELKFEEIAAHKLLTDALIEKGFSVKKSFVLPTAFIAEFDSKKPGPVVATICEYDALPEVGHACGHNLIAESGFGAGLAIKAAMTTYPEIPGKVVVIGTPAEEGGGGKIKLINAGVFNDVDVALMVHPAPNDHLFPPFIGIERMTITFTGKESHASGYPWEGLNALDAVVGCYNNIALLRQQIKPTCKVHGIITKGGDAANIIPGLTEMILYIRAATTFDMQSLKKRIEACIKSAAYATGCQEEIKYFDEENYQSLMTNKLLAEIYKEYAEGFGVKFDDGNPKVIPFMASSDMGNVSHTVPSIHPCYSIGTNAANHSKAFTQASGTKEAQLATLITSKSMAMVGLKVLCDQEFLKNVKDQFERDVREDAAAP